MELRAGQRHYVREVRVSSPPQPWLTHPVTLGASNPSHTDDERPDQVRATSKIRGVILALATMFWLAPTVLFAQTSKPNIVFILTDNLG